MGEINLFSKYDIKPKRKYWIAVLIIVSFGMILLDYFILKNRVANAESNLNQIRSEIDSVDIGDDDSEDEIVSKIQALENEKLNSGKLLECAIELCSLENKNIVLQDIQLSSDEIELVGFCWSRDDIYSLMEGLNDLGYELKLSELESVEDYYLFNVNGDRHE